MSFFKRKSFVPGTQTHSGISHSQGGQSHSFKAGPHERHLRDYFDSFDLPASTEPRPDSACIMLFMNRSGSSLVGEYMRATGKFSGFGEPFNHDLVVQRAQEHAIENFHGYLRWLDEHIHRPDTYFGMKASCDQVTMLLNSAAIPRHFADIKWAVVYRRDILDQAISFAIAEQTQQWHSFETGNDTEPRYDFDLIRQRIKIVADAYQQMADLCQSLGISPYTIYYEDFIQAPESSTAAFAAHLGQGEIAIRPARLKMRKQGNDINRQFRERFLADLTSGCAGAETIRRQINFWEERPAP